MNTLTRRNDNILHIWQRIALIKLKEPIGKQDFPVEYQELLLHLDEEKQNHVISQLYKKVVRFNDFNGADYFKTLDGISKFIVHNQLSCDLTTLLEAKEVEPKIFIDYLRAAIESREVVGNSGKTETYKSYRVITNAETLDTYLADLLPANFDHADIVKTLKNDSTYKFTVLLQTITNCIKTKLVNKDNVGAIFATYRLLASDEERPLAATLDSSNVNQLHSELDTDGRNLNKSGYYDLVAMQLTYGHVVTLKDDGDIKCVAEIMDYYADHGDLLIKSVGWNNSLLNDTLQYMVNNKLGYKLSLRDILPQFESIKNKISVTDEAFIEHLADWNTDLDKEISKNNIKSVIPSASFYDLTTRISNSLTDYINKIAIETLSEISVDTLYNQRANYASDYWLIAVKHLLVKIKSLPDNLTEFGKKMLIGIASGSQSTTQMPAYLSGIIEKLDKRKIKTTIKDLRNDFCNGVRSINSTIFQFFEPWFRLHGNLSDRAGDVVAKIVKPVITDATCRNLILGNDEFYIALINQSGDDAFDLKQSIGKLIQNNSDESFIKFAKRIGVELKQEIPA